MSFFFLFSLFSNDLVIDFGMVNICVFVCSKGIVVDELLIVVINKVMGGIEVVGKEVKEMLGRILGNIVVIRLMKDGVIVDFEVIEKMLVYFIRKVYKCDVWVWLWIVIGVFFEIM